MTKTCLFCGKEFETNRKQVVCCSNYCKAQRNRILQRGYREKNRAKSRAAKSLSKSEKISLDRTGKILAETIADNNITPNWQVPNHALRALYPLHWTPRPVIIPAAIAQNRKPTVNELLDWIFNQK